ETFGDRASERSVENVEPLPNRRDSSAGAEERWRVDGVEGVEGAGRVEECLGIPPRRLPRAPERMGETAGRGDRREPRARADEARPPTAPRARFPSEAERRDRE